MTVNVALVLVQGGADGRVQLEGVKFGNVTPFSVVVFPVLRPRTNTLTPTPNVLDKLMCGSLMSTYDR